MKLSVIVPVFNEVRFIDEVLARVSAVNLGGVGKEVIVVDDFSADGTREKLLKLKDGSVKVFFHEKNRGKGAALKTGMQHASGDIIIFQDADLEYSPDDYPALIKPIVDGIADAVYGSRFMGVRLHIFGSSKTMLPLHYIGNRFIIFFMNLLFGSGLSDMETCYTVFRSSLIKGIPLRSDNFDITAEITAKILRRRIRIHEVPIHYHARSYSDGKKISWKDGVRAVLTLLRYRFSD